MRSSFLLVLVCAMSFTACVTERVSQQELVFLPEAEKGKWWIINTILQDSYGKDVHFNSLISIDKTGGKNYAACFVSAWSESGNVYYSATRNALIPDMKFKNKFPVKILFPGKDSLDMGWSLVMKRNGLSFITALNSKTKTLSAGYTELSARFSRQSPFAVSVINASPQAWAVNPLPADVKTTGNLQSSASGKLLLRVFTDKELLLKKSSVAYVHWLDLTLRSGKQLSILFTTDTVGVKTNAVLLWDEQGNIMSKPQVLLQNISNDHVQSGTLTRQYPLFFSVVLPTQHLNIQLQPRMTEQEIMANKNSCWMGAVEAIDSQSGMPLGKGNMYIFKQ